MNFLYMISKSHYGDENGPPNQYSTLSAHVNVLHCMNIPPRSAPFHYLEELIIHSFKARIVALFLLHMREHSKGRCDIADTDQISAYITSLRPLEFYEAIDNIHRGTFAADIRAQVNMAAIATALPQRGKEERRRTPQQARLNHQRETKSLLITSDIFKKWKHIAP